MDIAALDTSKEKALLALVEKRVEGTPLAHLTGRQQFMGIELLTTDAALIPRKETEILGSTAVRLLREKFDSAGEIRVLDVCTGAGNLPVALAMNCTHCRLFASDLSSDAVALARENASLHNLADRISLKEGDLFAPFDQEEFLG